MPGEYVRHGDKDKSDARIEQIVKEIRVEQRAYHRDAADDWQARMMPQAPMIYGNTSKETHAFNAAACPVWRTSRYDSAKTRI